MMAQTTPVETLVEEFRGARRLFEARLRALPLDQLPPAVSARWSAREIVIHIAAWLAEGCERIPMLMAGIPPVAYDIDAFNAAAITAAERWEIRRALGVYQRAADRFETIAAELTDDMLDEEPDVRAWLELAARRLITEHLAEFAEIHHE